MTPTTFVVSTTTHWASNGPYLMLASAAATCPAGSVITGGYSHSYGAWDMYRAEVVGNAWVQDAEATVIMAPEHYIRASAICLRFN